MRTSAREVTATWRCLAISLALVGCNGDRSAAATSTATESSVAAVAPSTAADSVALAGWERQLAEAVLRSDSTAIARMLADDWTITLSDGRRSNKTRAIARWTKPNAADVLNASSAVDSVEVHRVGPDAAVLTAAITDVEVRAHGPDTTRTRVTDVVVRRDGRWQALVTHESIRTPPR
jgi:ketosteroid isomerase-like protein